MGRAKQEKFEVVADKYNPEVHEAAEKYLDDRHAFQSAAKAVESSKGQLIELMGQYNPEVHEDDGFRVVVETEDEPKVKLKVTDLTPKTAGDE